MWSPRLEDPARFFSRNDSSSFTTHATASGAAYQQFSKIVRNLKETEHYEKDEKRKSVVLTDAGVELVEKILGIKNLYATENLRTIYHLEQALKAQVLFHRDKEKD